MDQPTPAAGAQQPEPIGGRICGCGHGRAYHDPTCRLCVAVGEQAQQPEPEERRAPLRGELSPIALLSGTDPGPLPETEVPLGGRRLPKPREQRDGRGGETLRGRMERERPEAMQKARADLRRDRWDATWPDPFGAWTADQADAARAMKAALRAVADEEQQELHARLFDYENRITWDTNCGEHTRLLDSCRVTQERAERAEAERDRLRAELGQARERLDVVDALATAWQRPSMSEPSQVAGRHLRAVLDGGTGQARGTTGQATTVPAVGEQETRQQIEAVVRTVPIKYGEDLIEPVSSEEATGLADVVLPVVRAAVAAGVRRALEDAREQLLFDAGLRAAEEQGDLAEYGRELAELVGGVSAQAAVASPAREQAYPERHLWEVQVLIPGRPWRTLSSGYEDLASARDRADAANDPVRDSRIVRATTTYTVEEQAEATARSAVHLAAGANAEDCPACAGTNLPYPFLCPGEPSA